MTAPEGSLEITEAQWRAYLAQKQAQLGDAEALVEELQGQKALHEARLRALQQRIYHTKRAASWLK